ncbi:uncharacterized protein LOC122644874 [Telopea speciosissima]|uniref:uncharacterized protein LOC122644874 n=1 Tax=Telopea speciosissima TaxID=54955 RepID=UPI001CC51CAD|nr:uncharacterized protein LOC122644874 [Telopea speciosissima]
MAMKRKQSEVIEVSSVSERDTAVKRKLRDNNDPLVKLKLGGGDTSVGLVKKKLMKSDLNNLSRLILPGADVRKHVLPLLHPWEVHDVEGAGLIMHVKDLDTGTQHRMSFKKWESSGSYKLGLRWISDFVRRRNLQKDDMIVMFWVNDDSDSTRRGFCFYVAKRSYPTPNPQLCKFAQKFLRLSLPTPDFSDWSSIDAWDENFPKNN